MELHPVTKIMVFCLYCLKIKIIFVIIKLIIRSALAWLQFFFHSLSFPHLLDGVGLGGGDCLPGGGGKLGAS